MLNYSTEFPLDPSKTIDDVVGLACRSVLASPYTKLDDRLLADIPEDHEVVFNQGSESLRVIKTGQGDTSIGGLRYTRVESRGLVWTSSVVGLKTHDELMLSVQVSCEANRTAVSLPAPKKPYIIGKAIRELGGGMDGEVPVADKAFLLDEGMAPVAAALILGTAMNRLPIIYVSAGFDNERSFDPDRFARLVAGMAHVVVEPSRRFSQQLRKLVDAENVYGGTVGIYWPGSSARKSYFLGEECATAEALQLQIAKDLRVALSNRRLSTNCTWEYLQEVLSGRKYDLLRAQGSTEVAEYVEVFDTEMVAKNARLAVAEREIAQLSAEVNRLAKASQARAGGPLTSGKEQDLYTGEINDIVVGALQDALGRAVPGTRRQHVLEDLLKVNKPVGAGVGVERQIKSLLKTYADMDAKTRSELTRLGFDITEDGKHFKAVFQGDGRYTFAISKTSSDHRAGKNMASDICKTIF